MTLFQLFKDCKVDGVSRVSDFNGEAEQNAYYEGLERHSFYADFDQLGEPFLVAMPLEDAVRYKYGRMKFKSKWFYFSVDNVRADTIDKTWFDYTVDAWETARYQFGARLGRGTVNRCPLATEHPRQPHQPITMKKTSGPLISQGAIIGPLWLIAYARVSGENKNRVYAINAQFYPEEIYGNGWVGALGLTNSDITIACLTPFEPYNLPLDKDTHPMMEFRVSELTDLPSMDYSVTLAKAMSTTDTHQDVITDMRGNDIFEVPYGVTMKTDARLHLNVSASSISWDLRMEDTVGNVYYVNIPGEPIDVFIDQYAEYFARQRDQDIQTRKLQMREALNKGNASAFNGAISGSIAGGMSGAQGGTVAGGAIGLAGSVIGNYVNYGIDRNLQPRYQAIVDEQYRKAVDTLAMSGTLINSIMDVYRPFGITSYDWDDLSRTRFEDDVAEFGYYVQIATASAEDYYKVGPLAGDFEVLGVPDDWKAQIKNRFLGGVKIVS